MKTAPCRETRLTHSHIDIGFFPSKRIVHTITSHGNNRSLSLTSRMNDWRWGMRFIEGQFPSTMIDFYWGDARRTARNTGIRNLLVKRSQWPVNSRFRTTCPPALIDSRKEAVFFWWTSIYGPSCLTWVLNHCGRRRSMFTGAICWTMYWSRNDPALII